MIIVLGLQVLGLLADEGTPVGLPAAAGDKLLEEPLPRALRHLIYIIIIIMITIIISIVVLCLLLLLAIRIMFIIVIIMCYVVYRYFNIYVNFVPARSGTLCTLSCVV